MAMKSSQRIIRNLLHSAGICVDGIRLFDIRVHDDRFSLPGIILAGFRRS